MHVTADSAAPELVIDKHLTLSPQTQCYKITQNFDLLPTETKVMLFEITQSTVQSSSVNSGMVKEDFKGKLTQDMDFIIKSYTDEI